MLKYVKSENGFAILLVLLMILILSATVITVSASLKGQTNVSSVANGANTGLTYAENGLAIALSQLKQNASAFGTGFTINTDDGWSIALSYDSVNNTLTSTATRGRYRRSIRLSTTPGAGTGTGELPDYAVLSGGDITGDSGSDNINANSQKFFANGSIKFNNLTPDPGDKSKAALYAHGDVKVKSTGNYDPARIAGGKDEIPFPQLDFTTLVGKTTPIDVNNKTTTTEIANKIKAAMNNKTGNIMIVFRVDGQVTIDQNFDVGNNQNVSLVFIPKDANSSYKISMSTTNSNINGTLNLLADGGYYDLNKYSVNTPGVLYTNYPRKGIDKDNKDALTVNSDKKTFSFGGIMVNGSMKVDNTNWNFNATGTLKSKWAFLQDYWVQTQSGVTIVNGSWQEL